MPNQPLSGRKICVFAADMFEDTELFYPKIRLAEAGAEVTVVGAEQRAYHGKNGLSITPDVTSERALGMPFDAVVIPGGYGPDKLRTSEEVLRIVRDADKAQRPIAAICHAPWVLISAGVVKNRRLTCFWSLKDDVINAGGQYVDEPVVVDGNLITSRHPPDLGPFCVAIIQALS